MESPTTLAAADAEFIEGFRNTLQSDVSAGREYAGLLTTVSARLDRFLKESTDPVDADGSRPWGPVVCTTTGLATRITGPARHDVFEVTAASPQEASATRLYISALSAACVRAGEIRDRVSETSRKRQELDRERAGLSQPAEVTVDEHIRLLRQYNKTKDVAQQLIGLIADSRAVPVGSLYRDRDYGVSADD